MFAHKPNPLRITIGSSLWSNSKMQAAIPVKKHGRKAKSIFRTGLDHLRQIQQNLDSRNMQYLKVLQFLSCA